MLSVPSPDTFDTVTVRDAVPLPETETLPLAEPVAFNETSDAFSVTASALP